MGDGGLALPLPTTHGLPRGTACDGPDRPCRFAARPRAPQPGRPGTRPALTAGRRGRPDP